MTKKSAVIFDIDGTIADNRHRQHYIKQIPQDWKLYDTFSKDWAMFDKFMSKDAVYKHILKELLDFDKCGAKIIFVTGRRATLSNIQMTRKWIHDNIPLKNPAIHFRDINDYRDATMVKRDIYIKEIRRKYDVEQVFDDEKRILDMYAEYGIKGILCIEGETYVKV